MFIAALFIIARSWQQPTCPSTDTWIKMCYRWILTIVFLTTQPKSLSSSASTSSGMDPPQHIQPSSPCPSFFFLFLPVKKYFILTLLSCSASLIFTISLIHFGGTSLTFFKSVKCNIFPGLSAFTGIVSSQDLELLSCMFEATHLLVENLFSFSL